MKKKTIKAYLKPKFHRQMEVALEMFHEGFKCPECGLPTFWPYGGDHEDLRQIRHWLCKQCGYYIGPEGEQWALYDPVVDLSQTPLATWGCWQSKKDASKYAYLPKELVAKHNEKCRKKAAAE